LPLDRAWHLLRLGQELVEFAGWGGYVNDHGLVSCFHYDLSAPGPRFAAPIVPAGERPKGRIPAYALGAVVMLWQGRDHRRIEPHPWRIPETGRFRFVGFQITVFLEPSYPVVGRLGSGHELLGMLRVADLLGWVQEADCRWIQR
jgi:hypothetical protein